MATIDSPPPRVNGNRYIDPRAPPPKRSRSRLRSLLKQLIIHLYCVGILGTRATQLAIDAFRPWED